MYTHTRALATTIFDFSSVVQRSIVDKISVLYIVSILPAYWCRSGILPPATMAAVAARGGDSCLNTLGHAIQSAASRRELVALVRQNALTWHHQVRVLAKLSGLRAGHRADGTGRSTVHSRKQEAEDDVVIEKMIRRFTSGVSELEPDQLSIAAQALVVLSSAGELSAARRDFVGRERGDGGTGAGLRKGVGKGLGTGFAADLRGGKKSPGSPGSASPPGAEFQLSAKREAFLAVLRTAESKLPDLSPHGLATMAHAAASADLKDNLKLVFATLSESCHRLRDGAGVRQTTSPVIGAETTAESCPTTTSSVDVFAEQDLANLSWVAAKALKAVPKGLLAAASKQNHRVSFGASTTAVTSTDADDTRNPRRSKRHFFSGEEELRLLDRYTQDARELVQRSAAFVSQVWTPQHVFQVLHALSVVREDVAPVIRECLPAPDLLCAKDVVSAVWLLVTSSLRSRPIFTSLCFILREIFFIHFQREGAHDILVIGECYRHLPHKHFPR